MKKRDDELERSKRIARELEQLKQLKATQDREVASLMSKVSAWQLETAEIPDDLRALFSRPIRTTARATVARSTHALRG